MCKAAVYMMLWMYTCSTAEGGTPGSIYVSSYIELCVPCLASASHRSSAAVLLCCSVSMSRCMPALSSCTCHIHSTHTLLDRCARPL